MSWFHDSQSDETQELPEDRSAYGADRPSDTMQLDSDALCRELAAAAAPRAQTQVAHAALAIDGPDTFLSPDDEGTGDIEPMERGATLVVLTGAGAGRTHPVSGLAVIGRDPGVDLRLDEPRVSRRHAEIVRDVLGRFHLTDLGSTNGTMINGRFVARGEVVEIAFGDRISFGGDTLVLFTQHDHLHEQLLHRQRMESIGQLAGGVAHDFNNLLGTILANVNLMKVLDGHTRLDDPEVSEMLDDVRAAAEQAAQLTRQLLGFARHGKYEERPVSIRGLADEVARMCRRTLDRNVTLSVEVPEGLEVLGDRAQLHQLLMNVVLNARDAMPNGGDITLRARWLSPGAGRRGYPQVAIEIRDTGVGMSEAVRARAFEPFFTTKERGRGTGLGLASVYGIARGHGGDVTIQSEVGRGTCIEVTLPAHDGRSSAGTSTAQVRLTRSPPRGRVLLIDEDELQRRSLMRALRAASYEPAVLDPAASGPQLQAVLGQTNVVLLDLDLGESTARRMMSLIRAHARDLPILVLATHGEDARVDQALAQGARGVIRKPYDQRTLELALESCKPVPPPLYRIA